MIFYSIFFSLAICSHVYADDSISVFSTIAGKNSAPAKVQFSWGNDEIKEITVISSKGKLLQVLNISGDWTNLGTSEDHKRKDIFRSVDANFDGHADLLIESSRGTAGQIFKLFVYDPITKTFKMSSALDEVWNPTFDEKQKIVKGKANDMKPVTYTWMGDSLKMNN